MNHHFAVIILAAGLGTRMKSDKAKVLHHVCGRPMISYVLETSWKINAQDVIVVVGHQAEQVKAACRDFPDVKFAFQERQLGTGHAVQCALPLISASVEHAIILCGDVPLLSAETVQALIEDHVKHNRVLSLLAVEVDVPTGYGRIKIDAQRKLAKIVEEKDASPEEKQIKLINAGIYCVDKRFVQTSLKQITPDNAQKELYLTDIIEIGYRERQNIGVLVSQNREEVSGINTLQDLKSMETLMGQRHSLESRRPDFPWKKHQPGESADM